jgi:hypothetical protein
LRLSVQIGAGTEQQLSYGNAPIQRCARRHGLDQGERSLNGVGLIDAGPLLKQNVNTARITSSTCAQKSTRKRFRVLFCSGKTREIKIRQT